MRAADSGPLPLVNEYRLPAYLGGGQVTVRLHQNDADRKRRFNWTENVPILACGIPTSPVWTSPSTPRERLIHNYTGLAVPAHGPRPWLERYRQGARQE